MEYEYRKMVHAMEFDCQAPLKFYEHCSSCPRFSDSCPDLMLGKDILRRKKKLVYHGEEQSEYDVNARSFNCVAPLKYFAKTRMACGHEGRCREEGLLLALLSGKKQIDYSQKKAKLFPYIQKRPREEKIQKTEDKIYVVK